MNWILKLFFIGLVFVIGDILLCQVIVLNTGAKRLFWSAKTTPARETGLLLGTSPVLGDGSPNPFFVNRIEAASALYRAGKIHRIIASGDNSRPNYDEPSAMKLALIKHGVPAKAITLDYAGFRTLDSVVRAKRVFGADSLTIISQRFHVQRALLIADHYGMNAIGFCARDVSKKDAPKTYAREWKARVLVVLDLYVLKTQPHFQAGDANHDLSRSSAKGDRR